MLLAKYMLCKKTEYKFRITYVVELSSKSKQIYESPARMLYT